MKFEPFALERFISTWENHVSWNISESGVLPVRVEELLTSAEQQAALMSQALFYPQTNGTEELRSLIAANFPDATTSNIVVTSGGSEANCVSLMHLVEPGDEIVMMVPNYMQSRGVARALGAIVRPWPLVRDEGVRPRWRPDLERLASLVSDRTKAILICNPNNPTGTRMTAGELDAVGRAADRVGAFVIADEIYRGAEHDGDETPGMWGRAERVLVTSGLSKAYGLPGLRIGWVAGAPGVVDSLWGLRDYTTIAAGALSDWLARAALAPATRRRLLERTRGILSRNHATLRAWIDERAPALDCIAPEAGAIAFVRYRHPINSSELAERLRLEQSVLVVPGDFFDMDGYLRIGFGYDAAILSQGLRRVGELLDSVQSAPVPDAR